MMNFYRKARNFAAIFSKKINLENFIITDVVNVLHDFLDSINSGFMLLGASGSGKTTLLGYLIKTSRIQVTSLYFHLAEGNNVYYKEESTYFLIGFPILKNLK